MTGTSVIIRFISQRIVSVYESHQSAISQQRYPASSQEPYASYNEHMSALDLFILLTSAPTSDCRYRVLPTILNNLSVRRLVTSDHVRFLVRASSRR
jgi:hypothetical protein